MSRTLAILIALLVTGVVCGAARGQVEETPPPTKTKDQLPAAVEEAALIAVAEARSVLQYRGRGGGIIATYELRIKRVLKGEEKAPRIFFWLQLTSHDGEPEFSHPDPKDAKGEIVVLLKDRSVAEGDVFYGLVSREKSPTWWLADSAEGRRVEVLAARRPK